MEARVRAGRDALTAAKNVEGQCTALMGVSAGGVAALRVAELEPSVDGVVALLAGGGSEGFVHAARAYGASADPPALEEAERLAALDPARHAANLQGRPVLLGRAVFDGVIPSDSFDDLVSALGAPTVRSYATGHESFAYILPLAVRSSLGWVADACREVGGS
jgi:pimeloyl-ACP methyl ester carboxylesterase